MAGPTHYEVLGVAPDAPPEVIRVAWRQIAKECHPDRAKGDAEKMARFVAANTAQETLLDAERRAAYDAELLDVSEEEADEAEEPAYRTTGACIHCGGPTQGHLPVCFACVTERRDALRAAEQARRARTARVRQEREAWLRQMRRVVEAEERAQRARALRERERAAKEAVRQAMREAAARQQAKEEARTRRAPPSVLSREQEQLEAEYGHLADSTHYTDVFDRSVDDYGTGTGTLHSDDLLQALLGEAAIRSARVRAQRRSGVRVTVQLDPNVSVVMDEGTLAAMKEIGRNLGRANRVMGFLRRWLG
jgi:curved DNA-binding protein CbpA